MIDTQEMEFEQVLRHVMGGRLLADFDRHCEQFDAILRMLEEERKNAKGPLYYVECLTVRGHLEKIRHSEGARIPIMEPTIASLETRWSEFHDGLSRRERWALGFLDRALSAEGGLAQRFWYRLYTMSAPGLAA